MTFLKQMKGLNNSSCIDSKFLLYKKNYDLDDAII